MSIDTYRSQGIYWVKGSKVDSQCPDIQPDPGRIWEHFQATFDPIKTLSPVYYLWKNINFADSNVVATNLETPLDTGPSKIPIN